MQKIKFNVTNCFFFIAICMMLCASFKLPDIIVLQDQPLPFKPAGFYIATVTDDRTDKTTVAELIVKDAADKITTHPADMQGGAAAAIARFIEHNLDKDSALRPVVISIKEFKLIETPLANGSVDGRVKLSLSFGLQKDYGVDSLIDYRGGLHYTRQGRNMAVAEAQLRDILKDGLVYFNNWMKANINVSHKLANKVNITFTDYTEKPEGDTIYYATPRPLTWADFQSRVKPAGNMEAEVMPGFGYNQDAKIINGTINIHLAMKTYIPKSACWTGYNDRSAYALNHEQRHFDIVKVITGQYKQKVLAANLTPDTFEAFINMQYLDSYRDMDALQKAYDKETNHGRDETAQAAWNKRIDNDLKAFN